MKIIILLRLIIGIVFVFSAYSKLISPGVVEIIIIDQGFISSRELAAILVRILIGLELAIGILFFQPYFIKKFVIPISFIFLVGFTLYLFYSGFVLGDSQNCGCFGDVIQLTPVESTIKNIFFLLLLYILNKLETENKQSFFFPVLLFSISIIFVFVYSPVKSAENFTFSRFIYFENKGRADLTSGQKFLAVINTDCDHCRKLTNYLSELKNLHINFPEFYFLVFSDGSIDIDSFKVLTGFNFPYFIIDINEFFDLIGEAPPRIYFLNEGKIEEIWDDDFSARIGNLLSAIK